jgi:flagellar basal-body rod protein FlgC
MSDLQIGQIAGQGMSFERARVELATLRLALINMTFSSGTEATDFLAQLGVSEQLNENIQYKKVKDDANPLADIEGYVYKFDIDPTREMATLVSATRAYEANVRAYNANSQINRAALEIGSR